MADSEKKPTDPLGRLKSFGVAEPWQALLLAPNRYESLDNIVSDGASLLSTTPEDEITDTGAIERRAVVVGMVSRAAEYDPVKKRSNMHLQLGDGASLRVMAFGHPNQLPGDWRRNGSSVSMLGKLLIGDKGFTLLVGPRPIPDSSVGRAVGVYPGKTRVINPDTVRDRVLGLVTSENLRLATESVASAIAPYQVRDVLGAWASIHGYRPLQDDALTRAIHRLHMPASSSQGEAAKKLLADISALALLARAERERPRIGMFQRLVLPHDALEARTLTMSHTPTPEQLQAVSEALEDMASGQPMHRLLSGDVGTGKTTVFALLAVAVYDAGGEVGIMLPSEDMVHQVSREILSWWPDLEVSQVTGASKDKTRHRLRIGTTAMISASESHWTPTLMVVDEQQKYAAHQREALTQQGGHLLEATATCLPRTMAQLQFGLVPVSRLTKAHTPKQVDTELWDTASSDQRRTLFQEVKSTLSEDAQVLVIFAARDKKQVEADLKSEGAEAGAEQVPITSLEEGAERWRRVLGESEVAVLHGKMKSAERAENLSRVLSGEARVLCATTAAEVGLNLPRLRHAIINNPERFGLVTLHQIRGRLARTGGWGRCDMLGDLQRLPQGAQERLSAFAVESDGFALAERDMRQRGMGSLLAREARQSGDTDAGLLLGERPSMEHFETAHKMLALMPTTTRELPSHPCDEPVDYTPFDLPSGQNI